MAILEKNYDRTSVREICALVDMKEYIYLTIDNRKFGIHSYNNTRFIYAYDDNMEIKSVRTYDERMKFEYALTRLFNKSLY